MERASAVAVAPIPAGKKAAARVALVDLDDPAQSLLVECFRQFGIESKPMDGDAASRLQKEKFEACVVKMCPEARPVMESARTSPSTAAWCCLEWAARCRKR